MSSDILTLDIYREINKRFLASNLWMKIMKAYIFSVMKRTLNKQNFQTIFIDHIKLEAYISHDFIFQISLFIVQYLK